MATAGGEVPDREALVADPAQRRYLGIGMVDPRAPGVQSAGHFVDSN
jgi:hypothetical protein